MQINVFMSSWGYALVDLCSQSCKGCWKHAAIDWLFRCMKALHWKQQHPQRKAGMQRMKPECANLCAVHYISSIVNLTNWYHGIRVANESYMPLQFKIDMKHGINKPSVSNMLHDLSSHRCTNNCPGCSSHWTGLASLWVFYVLSSWYGSLWIKSPLYLWVIYFINIHGSSIFAFATLNMHIVASR